MRRYVTVAAAVALTLAVATAATAQIAATTRVSPGERLSPADRERAQIQNRLGWENMRAEDFQAAVESFQQAVEIDPEFAYAFYGLGRAHMGLKEYTSAISALQRARDIHVGEAGRVFSNAQEAQRYRNDRVTEIDQMIREVQTMPQNLQTQDLLRQLQNQRRDVQEALQRGNNVPLQSSVPAYVSLSLGSAFFRAGRMEDAEREYKATVAVDNKSGEAYNNLAVVYLMTGRYTEADRALRDAKKTGFRVNPQLEAEIKAKKKGGS